jgi:hypothetical protein
MRAAVRIAGLAAATALVLWCAVLAIRSFTPQAGAGLPRLAGGAGMEALLGLAALVSGGLVVAAAFALSGAAGQRDQPFWLAVGLLAWAGATAAVASRATAFFLAPVDNELGVGPGSASVVASSWATYFWTVAALAAALFIALAARRAAGARRRTLDARSGRS